MRSREVLMWSDRYAEDIPLRFANTQFPPTRSDFSKQSNGIPRSWSALAAAITEEPAPITAAWGNSVMAGKLVKNDGGVKFAGGVHPTVLAASLEHLAEALEAEDQDERGETEEAAQHGGGDLLPDREGRHVGAVGEDRQQQRLLHTGATGSEGTHR